MVQRITNFSPSLPNWKNYTDNFRILVICLARVLFFDLFFFFGKSYYQKDGIANLWVPLGKGILWYGGGNVVCLMIGFLNLGGVCVQNGLLRWTGFDDRIFGTSPVCLHSASHCVSFHFSFSSLSR